MREIKFRAWDGECFWHFDPKVGVFYLYFGGEQSSFDDPLDWQDILEEGWPVEQYTGLKDKNGAEIYEGDITQSWNEFKSYNQAVIFNDGYFIPLVKVEYGYNVIDSYSQENFEVIGNIHENPELLEG